MVTFIGEDGIDRNGLRNDFISIVVGYYGNGLTSIMRGEDSALDDTELERLEFAAGLYFGNYLVEFKFSLFRN